MMKLRTLILVVFFIYSGAFIHGNIHIVDTGRLPQTEAFNSYMQALFGIRSYVDHYSPEWRYPADKGQIVIFLTEFHNEINRINAADDYELNLLDVVIMSYLYNLENYDYTALIFEKAERMKHDRPDDYRSYWILGNFLISTSRTLDGYNEFLKIQNLFSPDIINYPAEFIEDFAYACLVLQMFENALYYYERAAEKGGYLPDANGIYVMLKNILIRASADNEYSSNEIWRIFMYNERYYLISRIFGVLIPVDISWRMQIYGLSNKRSFLVIVPERFVSARNNPISITVMIEFNLAGESYDSFLADKISAYPVVSRERRMINSQEFDILVYEDKSSYQNMGGARGYYICAQLRYGSQNNTSIELPIEINPSGGGGVNYFALTETFRRINEDINIGILVDSSNEIFNEASEFIFGFLNNITIE